MPTPPSNLIIWLKEWARLQSRRYWLEPRPVYVAAGLGLMAAMLLLVVVSGIRSPDANPAGIRPEVNQPAVVSPTAVTVMPREAAVKDDKAAAEGPANEKPRWPLAGDVRLAFGWQLHPLFGDWRYHPGVDIAAAAASPVRAIWRGQVSEVYEDGRYGLTVVVASGDYKVYYGSLAAARVEKGQVVATGTVIGTAGQAGSEPYFHLHLAVKKGADYIDPQALLTGTRQ